MQRQDLPLTGIYAALCTPYDADGAVHEEMLEKLVEYQVAAGVDGIWICGGSAEAALVAAAERKRILEVAVAAVAGRVRVLAHVGALGTENVLDLVRHAARQNIDGLSAVPPFFYRADRQGLHDYYAAIAAAAPDLPVLCYNVPGLTGVSMTCGDVEALLDIDGFSGLKYSSYDLFDLANIKRLDGGRLTVLSGNDEVLVGALAMGADGSVGLNHNYVPRAFVRIYRHVQQGNLEAARRDQFEINAIVRVLFRYGPFAVLKHIMSRKGFDCGAPRRPIRPLTTAETAEVDVLIESIPILWEDC